MLVHENSADAFQCRQRRPRGQFEDGLCPPAKKMRRVFAESKPHYIHLLKQRKNKPKKSIVRAEQHIRRVADKPGGAQIDLDWEIEEIEEVVEEQRRDDERGGGSGGLGLVLDDTDVVSKSLCLPHPATIAAAARVTFSGTINSQQDSL